MRRPSKRDRYACDQKQEKARIPIWDCLLSGYTGGLILLMPEKNRKELDILLAHGVVPEDVLAVDKSAAVLATFTRQVLSPHERAVIRRRGALVSQACEEWAQEGIRLALAHFDFCGNLDQYSYGTVRAEIEAIARSGIIDNAHIAVTFERGREANPVTKKFDRLGLLTTALSNGLRAGVVIKRIKAGRYQNGPSPMQWVIFEISSRRIQ